MTLALKCRSLSLTIYNDVFILGTRRLKND